MSTTTRASKSYAAPRRRIEPTEEWDRPAWGPADVRRVVRLFGGALLLSAGVAVCLWLVYVLHAAVFHPERMGMLGRLVPERREELVLTLPAGKVELPPGGMTVLAYFILALLAAIGAKVGTGLVREGGWVLRHDRALDGPEESPRMEPSAPHASPEATVPPAASPAPAAG